MSARKTMSHEQAIELLPWLINGSLDEDEREKLNEHAFSCVVCRRELQQLELINDVITNASKSQPIPEPDMRNINARIDDYTARRRRFREWVSRLFTGSRKTWRLAFALQTALVIALAVTLLWPRPDQPEFTTLTQAEVLPDGHYVRVVFDPEMAVSQLAGLLEEMELTIVAGPSARGIYTLGISDTLSETDRTALLASLQQDHRVQFAQWVVYR